MPSRTRKEDDVIVPNVSSAELESALKRVKEEEGEKTRLVALTMRESNKIQIPVARGFKFVDVPPLGLSPEVPVSWAEKMTEPRHQNARGVKPAVVWHVAPEPRPKNAQRKSFERDGRRFYTDIYAPSEKLVINGREIKHSVSQSIHFISRVLRTVPGIQRWITDFDTRPEVAAWGNYVIQQREAEERQALGVSASRPAMI